MGATAQAPIWTCKTEKLPEPHIKKQRILHNIIQPIIADESAQMLRLRQSLNRQCQHKLAISLFQLKLGLASSYAILYRIHPKI